MTNVQLLDCQWLDTAFTVHSPNWLVNFIQPWLLSKFEIKVTFAVVFIINILSHVHSTCDYLVTCRVFFGSNVVVEIFHSYGDKAVTFFFGTGLRGPMNWKIYQHIGEIGKKCTPFQWRANLILLQFWFKIYCSLFFVVVWLGFFVLLKNFSLIIMETSPLSVESYEFWPIYITYGYWAVRVL